MGTPGEGAGAAHRRNGPGRPTDGPRPHRPECRGAACGPGARHPAAGGGGRIAGAPSGGGQGGLLSLVRAALPHARRSGGVLPPLAPGHRSRRAHQRRVRPSAPQPRSLRGRRAGLPLVAVHDRPPPHDRRPAPRQPADPSPGRRRRSTRPAAAATSRRTRSRPGPRPRSRDLLAVLSPDQREVVLLRIVADLSVEQVARMLSKREGAIKALQHRALASLRRHRLGRGRTSNQRAEPYPPHASWRLRGVDDRSRH